jgi:hypothetical protein
MGSLMFIIGFIAGYIGVSTISYVHNMRYNLVTLVFIALTTMVLGTQLFWLDFLAKSFYEQKQRRTL